MCGIAEQRHPTVAPTLERRPVINIGAYYMVVISGGKNRFDRLVPAAKAMQQFRLIALDMAGRIGGAAIGRVPVDLLVRRCPTFPFRSSGRA